MRLVLSFISFVVIGSTFHTEALGRSGVANIVEAPPTVTYQWYPANAAPPSVVLPGMKGNTQFNFPIEASYDYSESRNKSNKSCAVTLLVNTLNIHLGLGLHITLPEGCSEHLRAHEEGHRHIYEYFYAHYAEAAARKAADKVLGQPLTAEGHNCKEAKEAALSLLNDKLTGEYRQCVSDPARETNDYYDKLTNHGRLENVDSVKASTEAIKVHQDYSKIWHAAPETQKIPSNQSMLSPEPVRQIVSSGK